MTREELETRVRGVLAEQLSMEQDKVSLDSRFREDLDVDSLDLVETVLALEEDLGVDISEDEMEGVSTVGEAVTLVSTKLGVSA